ncbi:MAG: primosomal protein N' [Dehalococcoidia bacterium]|nr:primosomal protein N' [Dehalococcoidia bacterium]
MRYAEVAVDAPSGRSTYSYGVPVGFIAHLGQLVWVPFGSRTVRGVVVELSATPAYEDTRDMLSLESSVSLSPLQLNLARWMEARYLCSLFAALALFLPPGTDRSPLVRYEPTGNSLESVPALSARQGDILRRATEREGLSVADIRKNHAGANGVADAEILVRSGLLKREETPRERRTRESTQLMVSSTVTQRELPSSVEALRRSRATKQLGVLEYLLAQGRAVVLDELRDKCSATPAIVRALEGRGLVKIEVQRVWRNPLVPLCIRSLPVPRLTEAQNQVWTSIRSHFQQDSSTGFLIFGVTGSGKTEVYLRAAHEARSQGKRSICLVPEIALAAQTVERFVSRFPGRVALIHSGLTEGQQFDEWERVRNGSCDVVVGPRSALFAPVDNLGLIVLDEEHEWTYKQDDATPRYHARAVAEEMARASGAVLLLGSATPDVETFHRAVRGELRLLELPDRIGPNTTLPPVEVVDMRQELRTGNAGLFSRSLTEGIKGALARHEQVLLFLNRRGTSTMVQCRECGHVFGCPRCSVALAHHSARGRLVCHRCGYSTPVPDVCPECKSQRLRHLGVGTQRVVDEVAAVFPKARVIRWDSDVPARVRGESGLSTAVHGGHVDIIVGTQMVAKGLDFPNLTLVGVVSADQGLNVPDYRSGERVFQLLCQAAGRAGRGLQPGRVVVQTYDPENYVVRAAATHDYRSLYREEIRYREEAYYPPFCSLVRLVCANVNEQRCRAEAERVYAALLCRADGTDTRVSKPLSPYLRRLRGRYRLQIILRGSAPAVVLEGLSLARGWTVDVDPVSVA